MRICIVNDNNPIWESVWTSKMQAANSLLLDHFQKKESWNIWNVEQCHICKVQHPKKWSTQNRLKSSPHFLWWNSHQSVTWRTLQGRCMAFSRRLTVKWMMCVWMSGCSKCQEPRSFPCLSSADLKVHRAPGLNMMCHHVIFHFHPSMFSTHPIWQPYAAEKTSLWNQILAPPSDASFVAFRHLALQQSKRSRTK